MKQITEKRQFRRYRRRVKQLPEPTQTVVRAFERYVFIFAWHNSTSSLAMLDDLVELFEQYAADGVPLSSIVADDPVEFIETFMAGYPVGSWIAKERQTLADAVSRAKEVEA